MNHIKQQTAEAFALHQQGNFAKAHDFYAKILNADPKNSVVLHLMGILSAQMLKPLEAIIYIKKAIAINPNEASFYNSLASVLKQLDQNDEAIRHYQQALKLNPSSAE